MATAMLALVVTEGGAASVSVIPSGRGLLIACPPSLSLAPSSPLQNIIRSQSSIISLHCQVGAFSVHVTFYCSESDLTDILFHFQVSTFITALLPLRGIPPPHPHVRKAGGKMREDERRSGHEKNRNRVHVLSALCLSVSP